MDEYALLTSLDLIVALDQVDIDLLMKKTIFNCWSSRRQNKSHLNDG
jgi:hypothetical protein